MFFGWVRNLGLRWFGVINTITTASLNGTTYQINFCVRSSVEPTSHCAQVFTQYFCSPSCLRKKETPEEKSQRLTQKGEAILAQTDFDRCVSFMRNRPELIASVKATLVAKNYWNLAPKATNTQAKQECDPAELKEIADDLQMRQALDVVQAAHPELVAIKILDVVLH